MNITFDHTELDTEQLMALEDYIFFKFATVENQNQYDDIVDTNFNNEIDKLKGEFLCLLVDDKDFNYSENEFNEWIKDTVIQQDFY